VPREAELFLELTARGLEHARRALLARLDQARRQLPEHPAARLGHRRLTRVAKEQGRPNRAAQVHPRPTLALEVGDDDHRVDRAPADLVVRELRAYRTVRVTS